VQALQAQAEQAQAAYQAAQDEIARLKSEVAPAGVPPEELEAAQAEAAAARAQAEQAQAAYAALQQEVAAMRVEIAEARRVAAREGERFEAEKAILVAEGAEGVALARGARKFSLSEYDQGKQLLEQAGEHLRAGSFSLCMDRAREATRLFNMAAEASRRAQEAESAALRSSHDKAVVEERMKYARALSEEAQKSAQEIESLKEERDRLARELDECKARAFVAAPPAPTYHVVEKGDCLWKIAEAEYGDPFRWPLIFWANRDKIKNPDLIYPKQQLRVPRDVSQDEIERAIREASERPRPKPRR